MEANQIIACDHPYVFKNDPTYEIQRLPLWISNWLKRKYIPLVKKTKKKFPKKFYIDRSDARSNHSYLRSISNEYEVKEFLQEKGFEKIILSNLDFIDQVKLFNNAEYIVGLHGAGFANIVFCKKNTNILEMKSLSAGNVIGNLAKKNKLHYRSISIKTQRSINDQHGQIEIPIKMLKKKLF